MESEVDKPEQDYSGKLAPGCLLKFYTTREDGTQGTKGNRRGIAVAQNECSMA